MKIVSYLLVICPPLGSKVRAAGPDKESCIIDIEKTEAILTTVYYEKQEIYECPGKRMNQLVKQAGFG